MKTKVRILILEDNALDAELVERELRKSGLDFTAELTCNRKSFHNALDKFIPDIILADYSLPDFDGLSALRLARERFPETPVIIVSGAIGEETAIEALKSGASDYVLKDRLKRIVPAVGRALNEAKISAEHKKIDSKLKEMAEKYSTIFDTISDGVWISDLNGQIIEVNDAYCAMSGYSREEIIGMPIAKLEVCETPEEIANHRKKIIELGGHDRFESQHRCKDGSILDLDITALFLKRNEGQIVIFVRDITERKHAEKILKIGRDALEKLVQNRTEELLAAREEAERSKRLSDIGVLSATVAHELRNPLAAIQMASYNIKRKAKNPDLDKHIATIEKKVCESDQIINNLLFYSRLKSPQHESVNIYDIIEECSGVLQQPGKKEVIVVKSLDLLKGVSIEADSLQIKEVFNNILNNAHDAVHAKKGRIGIIAENEADFIKVTVEDNGAGIGNDILDKIFDPFFTTKAKGTGLGLSVCRQIISMHGGQIGVTSKLGQGTSIVVRLPKKERKKERNISGL